VRFFKLYEPERIVGERWDPEWQQKIFYDRHRELLLATNGKAVVGVPVGSSGGEDSQLIDASAPKDWRKLELRTSHVNVSLGESTGDAAYPDVLAAVPRFAPGDPGTVSFIIDPALLLDLSKAIGMDRKRGTIRITAASPGLDGGTILGPMLVTGGATGKEIAVIAPCTNTIKAVVDNS